MSKTTSACKICGLPNWYITYYGHQSMDENGKCIFCNHYEKFKSAYFIDYEHNKEKFEKMIEKYRGKEKYDCIVLFTGGKDSCYTLHLMAKVFSLKTLAVTLDNGFFNELNLKNIEVVTKNLGVNHKFIRTDWNILKEIYRNRLRNYGRFCNCVPLSILYSAPIIYETKAPLVFFSSSFGQLIGVAENNARVVRLSAESEAALKESFLRMGAAPIKVIVKDMYDTMLIDILVGELSSNVLEEMKYLFGYMDKLLSEGDILYVNMSCYFNWVIENIVEIIKQYGWESPDDKGKYGHTSCVVERMKGYLARKQELITFDMIDNCALLRTQQINRDEFEEELLHVGYSDEAPNVLDYFLEKLDMSKEELDTIIQKKFAQRESLPEFNPEHLRALQLPRSEEQLKQHLAKTFKSKIII